MPLFAPCASSAGDAYGGCTSQGTDYHSGLGGLPFFQPRSAVTKHTRPVIGSWAWVNGYLACTLLRLHDSSVAHVCCCCLLCHPFFDRRMCVSPQAAIMIVSYPSVEETVGCSYSVLRIILPIRSISLTIFSVIICLPLESGNKSTDSKTRAFNLHLCPPRSRHDKMEA